MSDQMEKIGIRNSHDDSVTIDIVSSHSLPPGFKVHQK